MSTIDRTPDDALGSPAFRRPEPPQPQETAPEVDASLSQTSTDASLSPAPTEDALSPIPAHHRQESPRSIDHRRERICVQTKGHRIEGYVTLARDGFRSRVSDMLNASERDFLTLTDATVQPLDGGPMETHRFLAVARRHIVFAVVAENS